VHSLTRGFLWKHGIGWRVPLLAAALYLIWTEHGHGWNFTRVALAVCWVLIILLSAAESYLRRRSRKTGGWLDDLF